MTQGDLFEDQNRVLEAREAFSLEEAEAAKEEGMTSAVENDKRREALECARQGAKSAALSRKNLTATADDAYEALIRAGFYPEILGNAAGSLFRGNEWRWDGSFTKSKRISNHGRMIRVWRLELW